MSIGVSRNCALWCFCWCLPTNYGTCTSWEHTSYFLWKSGGRKVGNLESQGSVHKFDCCGGHRVSDLVAEEFTKTWIDSWQLAGACQSEDSCYSSEVFVYTYDHVTLGQHWSGRPYVPEPVGYFHIAGHSFLEQRTSVPSWCRITLENRTWRVPCNYELAYWQYAYFPLWHDVG